MGPFLAAQAQPATDELIPPHAAQKPQKVLSLASWSGATDEPQWLAAEKILSLRQPFSAA
jgi:hypothetical protein